METHKEKTVIAFSDHKKIARGDLREVAIRVKKFMQDEPRANVLIFDEDTSALVEVDFRGSVEAVAKRIDAAKPGEEEDEKKSGPGRPKLGVISKEITLLPHHWEWLAGQPGGASVTIRKLVEEAKKKNFAKDQIRQAQEVTHKFMTAMAGDLPSFEEALRSLYAKDEAAFLKWIKPWPKDLREHIAKISKAAF